MKWVLVVLTLAANSGKEDVYEQGVYRADALPYVFDTLKQCQQSINRRGRKLTEVKTLDRDILLCVQRNKPFS